MWLRHGLGAGTAKGAPRGAFLSWPEFTPAVRITPPAHHPGRAGAIVAPMTLWIAPGSRAEVPDATRRSLAVAAGRIVWVRQNCLI